MKQLFLLLLALLLAFTASPVFAQTDPYDASSFTIQNVGDSTASVTVTFVTETGDEITPTSLDRGKTNPFTLEVGESAEIYVPAVEGLPDGRFSVIISSDQQVVAIANITGQGDINYNGSYSGFSNGAQEFYLPSVVYNFYGWYSYLTVQNVGGASTDVNITITCVNGATGTYSATGVLPGTAVTFDTLTNTPSGFTNSTQCDGAAAISSTASDVVVIDNMRIPGEGNTQSYSGIASGAQTLYVPALYVSYYGWNANLNVRKLGSGTTTVTVNYSDGAQADTCTLTDASPVCSLYMPVVHPLQGSNPPPFGAIVTSSDLPIAGVVNAANGSQAQTYNAVMDGSQTVRVPAVYNNYYGWVSSVTCQNLTSTPTTLNVAYDGFPTQAYDTEMLNEGETVEILQFLEPFLPSGYQGGVTISANDGDADIACISNFTNRTNIGVQAGDWSMSVNAFSQGVQ